MLRELHISNLALIADATLELDAGLNCFTGQTGAGKSLVIGALEILLGLRSAGDMLRHGAPEGRVTGVFHLANPLLRRRLAALTDLPIEEEAEVVLVRRIFASGRTSASIGGHPISATMLKAVGETLADIHGQYDAQFLLNPANQLALLDDFGKTAALAAQFAQIWHQKHQIQQQLENLEVSQALRRQQLELYEFQASEIDAADLHRTPLDQLEARQRMLANVEKIKSQAEAAYGALYEDDAAVIGRLKTIASILLELVELDGEFSEPAEQVRSAAIALDEAAFSLRRRIDRLELNPEELAETTDRLNTIHRLIHKYAGAGGTLDDVLAHQHHLGEELSRLRQAHADVSALSGQLATVQKQLAELGQRLSAGRRQAAKSLIPLVHRQLADLGMKEARFHVEFLVAAAAGPSAADGSPQGLESVELMIAPNPGQPAAPLRKIASGGELSRIMLALKSILATSDRVSVLVFDEIDANVGGRMGAIIGEKLHRLARGHQVLCITHLPQIASFADRHITVHKTVENSQSFTNVRRLEGAERTRELAEMITGKDVTPTSLAQAQELLELARPTAVVPATRTDNHTPPIQQAVQKKTSARRGKPRLTEH